MDEALAGLGIDTKVVEMPGSTRTATEAAAAVGCDVAQIVKSMVFREVAGDRPVLALVSGADRVDEAKLAAAVGGAVERAASDFVRARTGFAIGGVSPVGHIEPVVTYVDARLLHHRVVWAAAGTPRAVFPVAPTELLAATGGVVADIADGPPAAPDR